MWSHIECVNISPKTYGKLQNDDVSDLYCPICARSLSFPDLRPKELKIFLSSDTIEHTQKPQKTPKKFSQISELNDPNKNTVRRDYYDLNDFKL